MPTASKVNPLAQRHRSWRVLFRSWRSHALLLAGWAADHERERHYRRSQLEHAAYGKNSRESDTSPARAYRSSVTSAAL